MLILASASPRRHELLLAAGISHIVRFTTVQETRLEREPPLEYVKRVAEEKARAIHAAEDEIVLGADTTVCVDGEVLEKPTGTEDAARMLRLLSGRDHWVHTGICLLWKDSRIIDSSTTKVSFMPLTEREIEEYTRSGEPFDKAGAYAIQGLASRFVSGIEGCYHNVVGLPVSLVYQHLKALCGA
jgi:septum formation protein